MTKLQEEIQAMGKTELVDYHNDLIAKHGGKVVKTFRSIDEARDKVYHLAWTHGLDDEAPQASAEGGEEETAKPNGRGRGKKAAKAAKAPAAAKGRGKKKPEGEGEAEASAAPKKARKASTPEEAGPLGTRPGTNKFKVVELLLKAEGKSLTLKSLAKKVYENEEQVGNLKMVLKGIAVACEANPRFKLEVDKDNASLTQVRK